MAVDIGPKIGISGESDFRKQIKNVNEQIKTLGTEMKVVEAAFAGQEKSEEALTAKSKVLTDEIGKQREKIDLLTKGLQESAEKYGENDDRTLKWKQAVNSATAELNKMENQLDKTTAELKDEADGADKAGDETEKAGKQAKDSESNWKGLGTTVAAVGAAMAAAAAAAGAAIVGAAKALTDFAVGGAEYADDILTMSTVTGVSAEKLQELAYAADLVDVSVDTITGSMKKNFTSMTKVQKGNKDLAAAYEALGVSVLDANGNLRDDEEVYWELIAALGNVEDETLRDQLAMELLGKSASDLNPLIMTGADGMAKLAEDAHKAGYVLSDEALSAFGNFSDQLSKLNTGAQAAKNALGTVLLPVLTELAGEGVDLLGQLTTGILDAGGDMDKITDVIGDVLSQAIDTIAEFIPEILDLAVSIITSLANALIDNLDTIVDAATQILTSLIEGISNNLPMIVESAYQILETLVGAIIDNLPLLVEAALDLVLMLVGSVLDNLPMIIKTGMDLLLAVVTGIAEALPELIPAAVDAVLTIVDTLIDNIDLMVDASIALIIALAEGIMDALPKLIEKAPEIIAKLVEALIKNAPKLLEASLELIMTIVTGLVNAFGTLIETGARIVESIKEGFQAKVEEAKQWGRDLIQNFVDGITEKWNKLKESVSGVAQTVKDLIGFSEPKEGPLSNFHTFAPDMIDLFVKGIKDSTGKLQSQLARSFDVEGLMGGALLSGAAAQRQQVVSLDASSLAALQASGGGGETVVSINFTGSLAQLGRLLQPEIQTATRLRGAALVTG